MWTAIIPAAISAFGSIAGGLLNKGKNPPAPPSMEEMQDVFDYISGQQSITVKGADGKPRRVLSRVPRSAQEEAIFDEAQGLMQSTMQGIRDLYNLSPALGDNYKEYVNAIGDIKDTNPDVYGKIFKDMPDMDQFVREASSSGERVRRDLDRRQSELDNRWFREQAEKRKGFRGQKRMIEAESPRVVKDRKILDESVAGIERLRAIAEEVKKDPTAIFKHSNEIDGFVNNFRNAVSQMPGGYASRLGNIAGVDKNIDEIEKFANNLQEFRERARDIYGKGMRESAVEKTRAKYKPYTDALGRLAEDREKDYLSLLDNMPDIDKFTKDYEEFMRGNIENSYRDLERSQIGTLYGMGYGEGSSVHAGVQRSLASRKAKDLEAARLRSQLTGQAMLGTHLQNVGAGYSLREGARGSVAQGVAELMRGQQLPEAELESRLGKLHDLAMGHYYKDIDIAQRGNAAQMQQHAHQQQQQHWQNQMAHQQAQPQTFGQGFGGLLQNVGGQMLGNYLNKGMSESWGGFGGSGGSGATAGSGFGAGNSFSDLLSKQKPMSLFDNAQKYSPYMNQLKFPRG